MPNNRARCIVCNPGRRQRAGVWTCTRHWRLIQHALKLALYHTCDGAPRGPLIGDSYLEAVVTVTAHNGAKPNVLQRIADHETQHRLAL